MGEQGQALAAGVALLERAIDYTLGSLRIVTPAALCRPTPCAAWNLQALLEHVNDSFQALNEAASGHIPRQPTPRTPRLQLPHPRMPDRRTCGQNPALLLRDGATEVLGRWAGTITNDLISIDDRHLTSPMVAAVGAIEIAVHGWDVARSCGEHRPIPPLMAEELLDLAHLFITRDDRPDRFASPVTVPAYALAQDHLLAYLGRDPDWLPHP
ncbi:maleylpyruvate isomerase family mycothiol-dependent enzyme [Nonomuraea sp. M3C6]|uniref:Maleylpyruvate isomerase family mycothiol-dependent enzyme n=1 Tax=Nonomuraea marmarensis TaxID=3351344 RepID=A0ABW7A6N0_9ACTN